MQSFVSALFPIVLWAVVTAGTEAIAQDQPPGDAAQGKVFFQQNCAICHADSSGPGNTAIVKQGPSLVGVVGRRAGSSPDFNYTKALSASGLTWDASTLDHFLAGPTAAVPGTTMPITVADAQNRLNLIAYLSTLKTSAQASPAAAPPPVSTPTSSSNDPGDWRNAAPGVQHHLTLADLPAPFSTTSAGNGPRVVTQPYLFLRDSQSGSSLPA
jgi:cytochrome c2